MIYQISAVQTKTQALSHYNKGLIQARHIQARLKEAGHPMQLTEFRSSMATNSLLPTNSWFD